MLDEVVHRIQAGTGAFGFDDLVEDGSAAAAGRARGQFNAVADQLDPMPDALDHRKDPVRARSDAAREAPESVHGVGTSLRHPAQRRQRKNQSDSSKAERELEHFLSRAES